MDRSYEQSDIFPDEQTYYVMDISKHKETPFNSLMFQLNEPPLQSKQTKKEIMHQYFHSLERPYACSTLLGEMLGYKQCIPHVMGEQFFVPDGGTSK